MGSTPVASGSSVPACPAFLAANARLTTDTAWVEVMPTGLSSTTQPSTLRFSRLRCGAGALSAALLIVVRSVEFALNLRRSQKLLDSFRLVESLVDAEPDVRCKFRVNAARDLASQEFSVAVERGQYLLLIAAA